MSNEAFLGSGLKFPLEFDELGRPVYLVGVELLRQSIKTYLTTLLGEVFFLRELGSRVPELLFDPNDDVVEGALYAYVKDTIDTWEKRIHFLDVKFSYPSADGILMSVKYRILGSNAIDSFIFPFYKNLKY